MSTRPDLTGYLVEQANTLRPNVDVSGLTPAQEREMYDRTWDCADPFDIDLYRRSLGSRHLPDHEHYMYTRNLREVYGTVFREGAAIGATFGDTYNHAHIPVSWPPSATPTSKAAPKRSYEYDDQDYANLPSVKENWSRSHMIGMGVTVEEAAASVPPVPPHPLFAPPSPPLGAHRDLKGKSAQAYDTDEWETQDMDFSDYGDCDDSGTTSYNPPRQK